MKHRHAALYLSVALASTALATVQPTSMPEAEAASLIAAWTAPGTAAPALTAAATPLAHAAPQGIQQR